MGELPGRATDSSDSDPSTNGPSATVKAPRGPVEEVGAAIPEAGSAAFAALLHLIRLMAADLVLNRPDPDLERFEQAVRTKIEQFTSPTANQSARDAGLAFARHLIEQVLTQLRAQVEIKKSLSLKPQATAAEKAAPPAAQAAPELPKFLN
jgi:hypothetical protein